MTVFLLMGGGLIYLIGWVWILITAFTENVLWGVGILLFSPLGAVFGMLKWEELKVPTLMMAGGVGLYILGSVLS